MRAKILCAAVIAFFFAATSFALDGDSMNKNSGASISGTIKVVKTRVKTSGAKSEKDVIVYLEKVGEANYPPPSDKVQMDQKGLVFIPHVMAVQKGTTVDFLNSDNEDHNVFCVDDCCKILEEKPGGQPEFMDLGSWGQGEVRSYTFNIPGEGVLLCKLHPEMAAYIVVLETPYFTTAEIDGESQTAQFSIGNVPPGKYMLKIWNKKCESAPVEVTLTEGSTEKVDVEINRKGRRRRR